MFDSRENRCAQFLTFVGLLLAEVKLYSSFSQHLHELVHLLRESNNVNVIHSSQLLFSPDS